jgi:hypothetical protein
LFTGEGFITMSMFMQATDSWQEQRIRDILAKGKTEEGKQLLVKIITEKAIKKQFKDAVRLHKLLIDSFPVALTEIIQTAEIIDHEKMQAIDKNLLAVWSPLVKILGLEEFSALYHIMDHRRLPQGEMIVNQGSHNFGLYFINNGRIELFYQKEGMKIPIKTIGAGEILGAGNFFEASVCTINAQSMGAEVSCLKMDAIQQLQKDFPGIDSKLNDFCSRFSISPDSFGKSGRDRRVHARCRISGQVKMVLFDRKGNNTGITARGDLFDISAGGASFFLRISQKNNARLLLGRNVVLSIFSTPAQHFNIPGTVRAVRSQPVIGNEYAVSVQFGRELSQRELKDLIQTGRERSAHP